MRLQPRHYHKASLIHPTSNPRNPKPPALTRQRLFRIMDPPRAGDAVTASRLLQCQLISKSKIQYHQSSILSSISPHSRRHIQRTHHAQPIHARRRNLRREIARAVRPRPRADADEPRPRPPRHSSRRHRSARRTPLSRRSLLGLQPGAPPVRALPDPARHRGARPAAAPHLFLPDLPARRSTDDDHEDVACRNENRRTICMPRRSATKRAKTLPELAVVSAY